MDDARSRLVAGSGDATAIAASVVEQAIAWYVQLASGTSSAAERREFERWLAAHSDHARAWQRLSHVGDQLKGSAARVMPAVTRDTMLGLARGRRRTLKTLLWLGGGASLAYAATPWRGNWNELMADVRTGKGEFRELTLADGSRLWLNTATAVDLHFDAQMRRIELLHGEMALATARDAAGRPLVVATPEGELRPIGTRFTVRRDEWADARTRLVVTEGAVEVRRAGAAQTVLVAAGQQLSFSAQQADPLAALDENSQSWLDATFSAERMRLADFLLELGRYRRGWLQASPEVADLRITGAWPLDGPDATDRILESLVKRLPVRLNYYSRYWVRVQPR